MSTEAGNLVNNLRKERGLSFRALAEATGISKSLLHAVAHGQRNASPYAINALVSVFGEKYRLPLMQLAGHLPADRPLERITEEQILYRIEGHFRRVRGNGIPYVEGAGAAAGYPDIEPEGYLGIWDLTDAKNPLAIRVQGHSLEEVGIRDGDWVIVDTERMPEVGELTLVSTKQGAALGFWPAEKLRGLEGQAKGVVVKVVQSPPRRRG